MDVFRKCQTYELPEQVRRAGLYSYFRPLTSGQDPEVVVEGRRVLMLGSNNYLGLTTHPEVRAAATEAIARYGTGCAGSRLLNGSLDLHERLEERIATFLDRPAALTFPTGYQTNLGVVGSLLGRHDVALLDALDHACIIDGARLGLGRTVKFPHNDVKALEARLARLDPRKGRLIVVDGVYSMEGDLCRLPEIVELTERYDARLVVDDAHGIGVLGARGRGTAEHFHVEDGVDLLVGTFSKSLATVGGFVAGDTSVIDYLRHHARPGIFSAALPPACAAAALAAIEVLDREPERLQRLWKNTEHLRRGLVELGFDTGASQSPVIPVVVGEDATAFRMVRRLQDAGVFVNCVVSPAVPRGRAMIRTSLMATHTPEQLDRGLEAFATVGRELGLLG